MTMGYVRCTCEWVSAEDGGIDANCPAELDPYCAVHGDSRRFLLFADHLIEERRERARLRAALDEILGEANVARLGGGFNEFATIAKIARRALAHVSGAV